MKNQTLSSFSHLRVYRKIRKQPDLLKELFSILSHYSNDFLKHRKVNYLYKLIKVRSSFLRSNTSPSSIEEREVSMKFLAVKFLQPRKVLGIALSFPFLPDCEKFDEQTLDQILKEVIPGMHILDESIYFHYLKNQSLLFCYFEIEKTRGTDLSFQECWLLKKQLPQKIKDQIEFLAPRLFTTKNEEDALKNIVRLHKEVRSPKTLPHIIISFQEQLPSTIKFSVVLSRIIKIEAPSIKELLQKLSVKSEIFLCKSDSLKKKYLKENAEFSLELPNSLFFRKNHQIDLLQARSYICDLLKEILGEFRDFNGGLLSKQTEQFDLIKKELVKQFDDLSSFEELFFSLFPSNVQLFISSEIALELCTSFQEIKDAPLFNGHATVVSHSSEAFLFFLKTNSSLFDSILSDLPSDLLVAKTTLTIHQQTYYCLVQIAPMDILLTEILDDRIRKILRTPCKNILNLHFQEGSPPSCHPHLSADIKTLTFCKALFEGLTRMNPQQKIEQALAQTIDISPCKKRYTFTLRPSKWSNGKELTSEHFAQAWKKAIAHKSKCLRVKNFFLIKNGKKAHLGKISLNEVGIYTPSKQQLIVDLEYPAPYFLQLLADPIYSPIYSIADEDPTSFNGPFLPTIHKVNKRLELSPNPMYWDAQTVKLQKVQISLSQDPKKAYKMYKNKELDWIGSPFNSIPSKVLSKSKDLHSYEANSPFWLLCNTKNPKLASPNIRKALSYAIDREKLSKKILPSQVASYSIIPEPLSTLTMKDYFPKNRIESALLLFEEGLKDIGYKRQDFHLTLHHSDIPEQKKLAYFLKASWEKTFNISVNLIEKPWNAYWNTFFNQEYEIGGFFSYTTYESPFHFMDFFEYSYNNFAKWENKSYQKYLALARQSTNECEKTSFLKKAEMILNHEMPVITTHNQTHLYCNQNKIENFILPKFGYSDFKWTYFENSVSSFNSQKLRISYSSIPTTFHPHLLPDIGSMTICKALYEGLTRLDSQGNPQPAIAEKIEISPCRKKYIFILRDSKWSNGEKVTSYHFANSWEKALSSKIFCAKLFFSIKNSKQFYDGKVSFKDVGIQTLSEKILIIELENPSPYFLQLLADPVYSPIYESNPDKEPLVFNGPFLLESYKIHQEIYLSPNSRYWDASSVKLKKIQINLNEDPQTAFSFYEKGSSDWIGSPFINISDEQAKHSKQIKSQKASAPFWIFCNTKNSKLQSPDLRKALSYAIDRKNFIKHILPNQTALHTILPIGHSFLPLKDQEKYDPKKAVELFELGLKEICLNKIDFQLTLNHSNSVEQEKIAVYLKDQWEKIFGIKVLLKKEDWNTFYSNIKSGNYEVGGFYLLNPYNDPSYFMEHFEYLHNNHSKWENQVYQTYLTLAKHCVNETERTSYLKQAEEILSQQMPVIPIYNHTHLYLSKDSLKNLSSPQFSYVDFKWVYFDD